MSWCRKKYFFFDDVISANAASSLFNNAVNEKAKKPLKFYVAKLIKH